jgi:adenosylhomocysteine nucleosidase
MPRVAIVAAMEREVKPLIRSWSRRQSEHNGKTFRLFEKGNVVLVCGGIGAEAARRAAETVIALYSPSIVYSAGFAGALTPEMKVGAVLLPRRVVDAGDGSSVDTETGEGVLVSFASVASPQQKVKLGESFAAAAVDMEAAAVARAAQARGLQFAAVKAISDEIHFAMPEMDRFVAPDGTFRSGKFAIYTVLRPSLWRTVAQLSRNSARASRALCARLAEMTAS